MDKWTGLSSDKQIIYYLGLSEFVIQTLHGNNYYIDARKALDICWEWLETKIPTADEIYNSLDDGTEFGGLFIQMQMDEQEENEAKWDCIVDAVSFVNKHAYIFEGAKYLPAPIENVDDELINHFIECFYNISPKNGIAEDYFEYILHRDIKTKSDAVNYFGR